jgi:hypothetical protein
MGSRCSLSGILLECTCRICVKFQHNCHCKMCLGSIQIDRTWSSFSHRDNVVTPLTCVSVPTPTHGMHLRSGDIVLLSPKISVRTTTPPTYDDVVLAVCKPRTVRTIAEPGSSPNSDRTAFLIYCNPGRDPIGEVHANQ